jgi:hypothetical protein
MGRVWVGDWEGRWRGCSFSRASTPSPCSPAAVWHALDTLCSCTSPKYALVAELMREKCLPRYSRERVSKSRRCANATWFIKSEICRLSRRSLQTATASFA